MQRCRGNPLCAGNTIYPANYVFEGSTTDRRARLYDLEPMNAAARSWSPSDGIGEGNPLGARAFYPGQTIYQIYRIHRTNQPSTIGTFVSSGCIGLTNEDTKVLHSRVSRHARGGAARPAPSAVSRGTGYAEKPAKPASLPSTADLALKRLKPPEIAAKLRQRRARALPLRPVRLGSTRHRIMLA
jgi:hypothetical protein